MLKDLQALANYGKTIKLVLSGPSHRLHWAALKYMDDQSKSQNAGIFLRCYGKFVQAAKCLRSPLLLVIRLFWGWQFFMAGKGKLVDIEGKTKFFQSIHIPFPRTNVYVVSLMECVGGILLMLGFGTRAVAALLAFDMVVAYLTADLDSVKHIWDDTDKFLDAAPFLFLFACVILLAFGPGRLSLDALIKNRRRNGQT